MKFNFPDNCCICMAKPETTVKLQKTKSFTPYTCTYSVEVPICVSCKNNYFAKTDDKKFKYSFIAGFAGLVIGGVIGAFGGERTEIFLKIFIFAAVGCTIGAVAASEIVKATYGHPPVEIDHSKSQWQGKAFWVKFDNQDATLFHQMNVDIYYDFLAGR